MKMYRKTKTNKNKHMGFTMIEMLLTMGIISIIFLAIGGVLSTMIRTSNTVSSRMLIREEGEYLAEVFRKYIRNSSADNVKMYFREDPTIEFADYEVQNFSSEYEEYEFEHFSIDNFATEIHLRPPADAMNKVICIGFFRDTSDDDKGYIVRAVNFFPGQWHDYTPDMCFPQGGNVLDQDFRKSFVPLNSDLVYIDGLEIRRDTTATNVYYTIDIDMSPSWGIGGVSNYRDHEGSITHRKSFVVQTRQLFHW